MTAPRRRVTTGRGVWISLLNAARHVALSDVAADAYDRWVHEHEAYVVSGDAAVTRGDDGQAAIAACALLVREMAARAANADPADRSPDWDAAAAVLEQCRLSITWGLAPEPIAVGHAPEPTGPTVAPHEANAQLTLLQMARPGLDPHEVHAMAGRWLDLRADQHARWGSTHYLAQAAAQLVAFLASMAPDPLGLVDQMALELQAQELAEDIGRLEKNEGTENP